MFAVVRCHYTGVCVKGGDSGEGNGNPLQYSCLEKSMGRGAWRAAVHGGFMTEHVCTRMEGDGLVAIKW